MSKLYTQLLFAFVFSALFATAQNTQDSPIQYLLKKAEDAIQKKEYTEALDAFEAAELICPSCLTPHFKKAMMYADLNDFKSAEKAMKAAYKINPRNTNNIWYAVLIDCKKGLFKEALTTVQELLAKETTEAGIKNWNRLKSIVLTREQMFNENKVVGIVAKGNEAINDFEFEKAVHYFDSASNICPICVDPHLRKSIAYVELKDFDNADKEIRAASVLSYGETQLNRYAAIIKERKGLLDEALVDIQMLIDKDTTTRGQANWYGLKAELEMKNKRYVEAYNDNCKVYSLNPRQKHTLYLMMLHELHTNKNEELAAHIKEFTLENANIDSARYYYDKGYLYYELKDYKASLSNFEEYLKLMPQNPNGLSMRSMTKVLIDPTADGLTDANHAVQLRPKSADVWNNRGFVKMLIGDYTGAIGDLAKAMTLNPKLTQAYNNLGYIYYKIGGKENYEKALLNYNKAMELGGKDYKPYWKYKEDIIGKKG